MSSAALPEKAFRTVQKLAYDRFGLNLGEQKRELVAARLGKQARGTGCETVGEYVERVTSDRTGEMLIGLIDALTTNYTSFLREPAHFERLRKLASEYPKGHGRMQVWCAAAATGEEPYTIAMSLLDELGDPPRREFSLLATDISTRALAKAQAGVYEAERASGLPEAWRRKYFQRGRGRWEGHLRIDQRVRSRIGFDRYNLVHPHMDPGQFHYIFCRNVLIYFDGPTQEAVITSLSDHLERGGYLFVGHAESLFGSRGGFEYVAPSVYRKGKP
jgi:chemotaxis protein methyltransferase CheR